MTKPRSPQKPKGNPLIASPPQLNSCRFKEAQKDGFPWMTGVVVPLAIAIISSGLVGGPISYYTQKHFNAEDRKWKLISSFGESYTALELCAKSLDSQLINLIDLVDRSKPNQMLSEAVLNTPFEKIKTCASSALSLSLWLTGLKEQNSSAECLYDNLQTLEKSLKYEIGQAINGKVSSKSLLIITEPTMSVFRSKWRKCSEGLRQIANKVAGDLSK
jgi:hypothetical protein